LVKRLREKGRRLGFAKKYQKKKLRKQKLTKKKNTGNQKNRQRTAANKGGGAGVQGFLCEKDQDYARKWQGK